MDIPESGWRATGMRRIVVGVDGSPTGAHALAWALSHAQRSGGAVVDAVHVYRPPAAADAPVEGSPKEPATAAAVEQDVEDVGARLHAEQLLQTAVRVAVPAAGVHVRALAVPDRDIAAALLDRAKTADLLVIGSCREGRRTSRDPAVSQRCLVRPPVPVVVVPAPEA